MLHESPVLTGRLIYCLRSRSQRSGWNLGFTVPDALLTEQVTSGSCHLISSSLSHPSWRRGEKSPPATLTFLCTDSYLRFYFLRYRTYARRAARSDTKRASSTAWTHVAFTIVLRQNWNESSAAGPLLLDSSQSWNRNSSKQFHTTYVIIFCLCQTVRVLLDYRGKSKAGFHHAKHRVICLSPSKQNWRKGASIIQSTPKHPKPSVPKVCTVSSLCWTCCDIILLMLIRLSVMLLALSARLSFVVFLKKGKNKAGRDKIMALGKMLLAGSLDQSLAPNIYSIQKTQPLFIAWEVQIIFTKVLKKKKITKY